MSLADRRGPRAATACPSPPSDLTNQIVILIRLCHRRHLDPVQPPPTPARHRWNVGIRRNGCVVLRLGRQRRRQPLRATPRTVRLGRRRPGRGLHPDLGHGCGGSQLDSSRGCRSLCWQGRHRLSLCRGIITPLGIPRETPPTEAQVPIGERPRRVSSSLGSGRWNPGGRRLGGRRKRGDGLSSCGIETGGNLGGSLWDSRSGRCSCRHGNISHRPVALPSRGASRCKRDMVRAPAAPGQARADK